MHRRLYHCYETAVQATVVFDELPGKMRSDGDCIKIFLDRKLPGFSIFYCRKSNDRVRPRFPAEYIKVILSC